MSYKTILVHVDNGKRCAARLDVATRMARRFDAHLVGLNALTALRLPTYAAAEAGAVLIEAQQRSFAEQSRRAKQLFDNATGSAGLSKTEWRASEADAVDAVTLHARYADLIVLSQPNAADEGGVEDDFAERVVLACGRPVLMIPFADSFKSTGERVLVAWNATREATRALTDALPMLRDANEVKVIAINPEESDHGAVPAADISLFLARHGVRAEAVIDHGNDIDVGNELLSRAADFNSDLIVMGAYGHSRMRELIMGGATRTIITSMTVPVLLSH
ncbi:MAG: universal stress protein [Betaproteobacteria bacterium]|nr:universal stress protein [Betaproteobacteria bacterium]